MGLITRRRGGLVFLVLLVLLLGFSLTAVVGAQEAPPDKAGCIYGQVWFDTNHNGVQDANEDVANGASVFLLGVEPFEFTTGPYVMVDHQLARDDGTYEFCKVRSGTYELRVLPPKGVSTAKLYGTAASNPTGPFPFVRDEMAMFNFGLAYPYAIHSTDTLNEP
ncbi:MAG: SdrD B-like domain-containing protein [Candidatus Promineifilaceae bacterium]